MKQIPDEGSGVVAVLVLGDRSQCSGCSQTSGNETSDLDGSCRDEPNLVPTREVGIE